MFTSKSFLLFLSVSSTIFDLVSTDRQAHPTKGLGLDEEKYKQSLSEHPKENKYDKEINEAKHVEATKNATIKATSEITNETGKAEQKLTAKQDSKSTVKLGETQKRSTSYIVEHTYLGYEYEKGTVWPQPRHEQRNMDMLYTFDPQKFKFVPSIRHEVLLNACSRYKELVFPDKSFTKHPGTDYDEILSLEINVEDPKQPLDSASDESYELLIKSPASMITAKSVWGALRGLETFSQVVFENGTSYVAHRNKIIDFPRFTYRGFLVDTSRHYLSLQVIFQFLDAMAYSKFNVLHWHIVDDPSFPYVSKAFPELHQKGAFNPNTHVYTPEDVQDIIEYAKMRGIRVMPEFDTPGHVHSWLGVKDLLTKCGQKGTGEEYFAGGPDDQLGPLNVIKNSTYEFIEKFFAEVAEVFPERYIHLGGDEVDFECWLTNPEIQAWLLKQPGSSGRNGTTLHTYYLNKLVKIIEKLNKRYVVWQEVFDDGVEIDDDTIVNVWKDEDWKTDIARVTKAGHKAILSSCWYLNYIDYGLDWPKYYRCDPQDFFGTEKEKDLVIGGSAAMWGEYVDATNLIPRSFGRSFAVAERLWSSKDVTDIKSALMRIWEHQCRYLRRGIPAEPVTKSRFCKYEWNNAKQNGKK